MISVASYPETADIETSSDDYARRFAGRVGEWFLKVQEEATLGMLGEYPGARILDVGGGHGQMTGALVRRGFHTTVFASAESCRARISSYIDYGQVEFNMGNILALPYPDRAFDVVLSFRLLPHVNRWRDLIVELARVAGRAVILDYPEMRSINYIAPYLFRFKKKLEGNTRTYTCFNETDLLTAFRRHRFVCGDRFAEFSLPMVLHRKLNQPGLSARLEDGLRQIGLTNRIGSPVILKLISSGLN
jgi:2-polyprenyl-3-methyl-5-hydroxy-6-metoxy-1,4-benzoquinol methylase